MGVPLRIASQDVNHRDDRTLADYVVRILLLIHETTEGCDVDLAVADVAAGDTVELNVADDSGVVTDYHCLAHHHANTSGIVAPNMDKEQKVYVSNKSSVQPITDWNMFVAVLWCSSSGGKKRGERQCLVVEYGSPNIHHGPIVTYWIIDKPSSF